MVSSLRVIIKELRVLESLFRVKGVDVEIKWLPEADHVNDDRLSRKWDTGDIKVTRKVL